VSPFISEGDFFLNIGANDGITNDPIYDFIAPFKLKGIAVEPLAFIFGDLQKNLKNWDVACENAALCMPNQETFEFYRLSDEVLEISSRGTQCSAMSRQTILNEYERFFSVMAPENSREVCTKEEYDRVKAMNIDDIIVKDETVKFLTLDALLSKYDVKKVDILNLDIEELDFDIFSEFDFEKYKPKVLFLEDEHFSTEQKGFVDKVLQSLGFQYVQKFSYFTSVYGRHL